MPKGLDDPNLIAVSLLLGGTSAGSRAAIGRFSTLVREKGLEQAVRTKARGAATEARVLKELLKRDFPERNFSKLSPAAKRGLLIGMAALDAGGQKLMRRKLRELLKERSKEDEMTIERELHNMGGTVPSSGDPRIKEFTTAGQPAARLLFGQGAATLINKLSR